jgi:hypothetical protein
MDRSKNRTKVFLFVALAAFLALVTIACVRYFSTRMSEQVYLVLDGDTLKPIPNIVLQAYPRPRDPNSEFERFFASFFIQRKASDTAGRIIFVVPNGQRISVSPHTLPPGPIDLLETPRGVAKYHKPAGVERVFFFARHVEAR